MRVPVCVRVLTCHRNFFLTQFGDKENLSNNTLLEIDMADLTESHLTGADQSCGLYVSLSWCLSVCLSVCLSHCLLLFFVAVSFHGITLIVTMHNYLELV